MKLLYTITVWKTYLVFFRCGLSLSTSLSLGERIRLKTWKQIRQIFDLYIVLKFLLLVPFSKKKMHGQHIYETISYNVQISDSSRKAYISGLFAQCRLARMHQCLGYYSVYYM